MSAMNLVYHYQNQLYVNVTNRCTNHCSFCIRFTPSGVDQLDLWLKREPTAEEIIEQLKEQHFENYPEIVFCGYGEPLMRFDVVMEVCRWIRKNGSQKIRINTSGHASHCAKRDVTPEMKGLVDTISISLNASTAAEYQKICKCDFGEDGFYEMLDFAKKAKEYVPHVVMSVVDVIGPEEIEACRKVAESIGVEYRVREYSE